MNEDYIRSLIAKYREKGILVDTNILLLFFVGSANPKRISRFSRTQQFDEFDFELLLIAFQMFSRIISTPHILVEVYNLINQIGEPDRYNCLVQFAQIVQQLDKFEEIWIGGDLITRMSGFPIFGLTDCGIEHIAKDQYLVLTDDLKLAKHLESVGIDVINFNHIRFSS